MRENISLITVIIFVIILKIWCHRVCNSTGEYFNDGFCYKALNETRKYNQSDGDLLCNEWEMDFLIDINAHLLSISDMEEDFFVDSVFYPIVGSIWWIGLVGNPNTPWFYTDESEVSYYNISSISNRNDSCHVMEHGSTPTIWREEYCNETNIVICKYEVPICNSTLATDFGIVCNGRGDCWGEDECVCWYNEMYTGNLCEYAYCSGLTNQDIGICSTHGKCEEYELCSCETPYYGPKCLEYIENPTMDCDISMMVEVELDYYLDGNHFYLSGKGHFLENSNFDCSDIIYDWESIVSFSTSSCRFTKIEYFGYEISEKLVIHIIDSSDPSFTNYELPSDNLIIRIIPVTTNNFTSLESQLVTITLEIPDDIDDDTDDNDDIDDGDDCDEPDDSSSGRSYVWMFFTFPTLVVFFLLVCCLCYCFLLGVLIPFFCVVFVCCGCVCYCCCYNARQGYNINRLKKLDNFEVFLEEQRLQKMSLSEAPKFKLDKKLALIEWKRLKLKEVIGEGGSEAIVYKCEWNSQIVAFKCFSVKTVVGNVHSFEEFEREANLLVSIGHPNIVHFYGCVMDGPRIGMVMEYCVHGDLSQYIRLLNLKEEKMDFDTKLRILQEITSAMQYLHARKIIHRDLKCGNVLLAKHLVCKIMDFGMSRFHEHTEAQQKTSRIGTGIYMAPEVVMGEHYNELCDVYSFAMLTHIVLHQEPYAYGEMTRKGAEMRAATNPLFRPIFIGEFPNWIKNLTITNWDHDPRKRKRFDEIMNLIQIKRIQRKMQKEKSKRREKTYNLRMVRGASMTNILNNNSQEIIPKNEGIFIYIKEKNKRNESAERFMLMKPTYTHLVELIHEFWDKEVYRVRKMFLIREGGETEDNETAVPIIDDVDVQQLEENDLVDVIFMDMEKSKLYSELENAKTLLDSLERKNLRLKQKVIARGGKIKKIIDM